MTDFRKLSDIQDIVFQKVKERSPEAEQIRAVHIQSKFLDGILYTIVFHLPGGADQGYVNRVFVRKIALTFMD